MYKLTRFLCRGVFMPQDILVWIPLNLMTFLAVHFAFAIVGLTVKVMNEKHITVENLIYALFFGIFYFLNLVWDKNAVVLDFRPNKQIQKLNEEIVRHINEKSKLQEYIDADTRKTPERIDS